MSTHVRVIAAALMILGLITGCQRTTPGTVAMTTEPGPPLATRTPPTSDPGFQIPGLPLPTRNTDIPEVPAPPNALTMECDEFNDLDEATKLAVIRAILAQENSMLGPDNEQIAQLLAESACQFLSDATVSEVLMGGGPP
ncbi:MAG: hypothetical protein ABWY39_08795 [Mycobacterium sp.]